MTTIYSHLVITCLMPGRIRNSVALLEGSPNNDHIGLNGITI